MRGGPSRRGDQDAKGLPRPSGGRGDGGNLGSEGGEGSTSSAPLSRPCRAPSTAPLSPFSPAPTELPPAACFPPAFRRRGANQWPAPSPPGPLQAPSNGGPSAVSLSSPDAFPTTILTRARPESRSRGVRRSAGLRWRAIVFGSSPRLGPARSTP